MDNKNVKKVDPIDLSGIALSECKYCKPQSEGEKSSLTNCPYCKPIEAAHDPSTCPYCAAMKQDTGAEDSQCQYCVEMTSGPNVTSPTATDSQDFVGQNLNAPEIPKPQIGDEGPILPAVQQEIPSNSNLQLDPTAPSVGELDPNAAGPKESVQLDQSKEAMIVIAQQIENDGQTPAQAEQQQISAVAPTMNQVDVTQEAVGTNMQGNVSRPASYSTNVPGDMGLSDDAAMGSPDLTEVFQAGLDSQANNIQREKVVQMVSEALVGFKASKQIIERAKEQAPQLYTSSIMMLKAMIEMAKMLGLAPQGESAAVPNPSEWENPFPVHPDQGGTMAPGHATPEGQSAAPATQDNEWQDPFPVHPDQGGQATPGHAPSKDEGGIGQGVGTLPTSATTQHVARTPVAEGGINEKGQKKITDPVTGEVRWIDMKQGRVQSPTGVPVKP